MKYDDIAIITDSCADVPVDLIMKYRIFVLPMMISTETGWFRDGVDITAPVIYEKLKTELPKSSTPCGEDIEGLFERLEKNGVKKAIAILLSSGLSSTVNHVRLAAEDSNVKCFIIDSLSASIGSGGIVLQTALWREEGMDYKTLCLKAAALRKQTKVFFSIHTLEYLAKGGRISKAAAAAGNVLNIKPILSFDNENGEIYVPAKLRGTKLLEKKLISLIQEYATPYLTEDNKYSKRYNIVVADGGNVEEGNHLQESLTEAFPDAANVFRSQIGATLGIYLGPKLLGAGIQFFD